MANEYSAKSLRSLKGLEPVRERPGMYIGSTDTTGLHHLVWELIDNAVDEANAGYGKNIYVTLNIDGSVSVQDEGRGVPSDFNEKEKKSGFDMVYRTLHSGGKFDETNYKTAGGLHGVGASVVTALSEWIEIHSYRDGVDHFIRFTDGGKNATSMKETPTSIRRGTKITFYPDKTIFPDIAFDYNRIYSHIDDSACLTKGTTFHIKDEKSNRKQDFYYENGLVEYFQKHTEGKEELTEVIQLSGEDLGIKVDLAFQYFNDDYGEKIFSFANGVRTPEGGFHVTGLKKAMSICFNNYALNHNLIRGKTKLEGDDLREGITGIISCWVPESILQFEGQTKSKLGTKEAAPAVDNIVENKLNYYLEEHPVVAEAIIKKTLDAMAVRQKAREVRDNERKKISGGKSGSIQLSGKLSQASGKNYAENELFIVEGDSAGGSAKKCRDREHQAILPLRGKPKNVTSSTNDEDILDNRELATLIATIGAGFNEDFNIKNIHYGKIIIMADADVDGAHIQNLLLSFFYTHMRDLIRSGHIYIACPPLYRIFKKGREQYCWSDEELEEGRKEFGAGYLINRYKGLGEMNHSQLGDTTMNKKYRRLIQVRIEDEDECSDKVDLFMGKDSDRRKDWINNHIDFASEDHFMEVKGEKQN